MVIIEGCDCTGKTHLVNSLKEALGWRTIKDSFNRNGIQSYLDFALKNPEPNIIADRFLYGEYVYPVVKRDGRFPLLRQEQHLIERVLNMSPSVLIYCETDVERIAHTFDTRGEDFVTKDDIPLILELFNERYEISLLPKMRYNYTTDNPADVLNFVMSEIDRRKELCDLLAKFEGAGEYVDHPIMLVGESYLNDEYVGSGTTKSRALSRLSGSSLYLSEALLHNPKQRYYLTNAVKYYLRDENIAAIQKEVELIQPCEVIALGKLAGDLLDDAGIDHQQEYHPSYWKRYHKNSIENYAKLLKMKKYNIIYADPCWRYNLKPNKAGRTVESHYDTMDIEDIKALPVGELAAESCVLFMWATFPKLQEGLDAIKAWGFEYKTIAFNWVKTNRKNNNSLFWGMGKLDTK